MNAEIIREFCTSDIEDMDLHVLEQWLPLARNRLDSKE
jgi:hypothetical protein